MRVRTRTQTPASAVPAPNDATINPDPAKNEMSCTGTATHDATMPPAAATHEGSRSDSATRQGIGRKIEKGTRAPLQLPATTTGHTATAAVNTNAVVEPEEGRGEEKKEARGGVGWGLVGPSRAGW